MQVNTFGGHPVAAAVAERNLQIMMQEKLAERAAETGAYLMDGLKGLLKHRNVGDVRGKGLLIGVELVRDKATKEQLDNATMAGVIDACKAAGVIVGRAGSGSKWGTVVALCPPLVITRAECDRIVETLDKAIAAIPA